MKTPSPPATIRFPATLAAPELTLPRSARSKLPSQGMIEGTLNGFPFRTELDRHRLKISKAMLEAAGAEEVTVEITRAGDEPEIRMPADLRKALAAAPRARAMWTDITPLARRDWILWISTAKQPETRRRRIEAACDKLASGMRRVCCFPGLKWLAKNQTTWIPLPESPHRA